MDIAKFKNNYNTNLIIVAVVISFVFILSVGAVGFMYISDTEQKTDEQYGLYDSIPAESNFVMQFDMIGLAEDQITRDVTDDIYSNFIEESEEDWYNNTLEEYYNETNMIFDEELPADLDFKIQDINNMMLFTSYDEEDIEGINSVDNLSENEEDSDIGYLIDIELTKNDIQTIIEQQDDSEELDSVEYNDYEIYNYETSLESTYYVILDDGIVAMSNSESYIQTIIDTHNGDKDSINKDIIPENHENTYLSFAMDNADIVYDIMMEEIEDIEQEPFYDDLSEQDKQTLDDIKDLPTPQTLTFSYSTDNVEELQFNTEITFSTRQAASYADRYFEESDENIRTDVTIDTTKIIIEQTTTSDVVFESILAELEENESIIMTMLGEDSNNQEFEDRDREEINDNFADINKTQQDNHTKIEIEDAYDYDKFHVLNPDGESVGVLNESINWTDTYPRLENESYTVIGVTSDYFIFTELEGSYQVTELYLGQILDENSDEEENKTVEGSVEIDETYDEIMVTIVRNENVNEFYIIDTEDNRQSIGTQVADSISVESDDYVIVTELEDGSEYIIETINTTEDEFEDYDSVEDNDTQDNDTQDNDTQDNDTQDNEDTETEEDEDISSTTTVSEEELTEDEMIKITIEENEFVDEFRVIDPDGLSHIMDSEIGTTEEYPKPEDGYYRVIAILEDGSEEHIDTVSE